MEKMDPVELEAELQHAEKVLGESFALQEEHARMLVEKLVAHLQDRILGFARELYENAGRRRIEHAERRLHELRTAKVDKV